MALQGEEKSVSKLAWSPCESFLAVGCSSGIIKVFKFETQRNSLSENCEEFTTKFCITMNQTLQIHTDAIVCIAWNPFSRKFLSADQNGTINAIFWVFLCV